MIKRRFYKLEHGDRDAPSESSSSSSDFELEEEETDDSEEEVEAGLGEDKEEENVNDLNVEVRGKSQSSRSLSSGYASEDSSANEVNLDSSGDETDTRSDRQTIPLINASGEGVDGLVNLNPDVLEDSDSPSKFADCVLKCKSVYKCKLCPRIVCLTEATLQAHLKSKRHARSEKLLKEGRLKCMLNDDGRIEVDNLLEKQALEEDSPKSMNKKRGRHGPKKGRNRKGNTVKRRKSSK